MLMVCLMAASALYGQTMTLHETVPKNTSNTAVIVCPGGSYYWLGMKDEGRRVAEWLNANGIASFVLEYPTSGWASFFFHIRSPHRSVYPAQLESLKAALKIVKSQGFENVGVMGFSAGGHLVLNAAIAIKDSLAPDFVSAIYPVVSMREPYVHKRSRRGLLGERKCRDPKMHDSLSIELHAGEISCPLFLMNCVDDKTVDYHNSVMLHEAMLKNRNSHLLTYIQYQTGDHGFGANEEKMYGEAVSWKPTWLEWLKSKTKFKAER